MARGSAVFVAAGILSSRLFGLVRQRVIAHYVGQSTAAADAVAAAFRIPNFLQNLFGEGVLSASLIPEYTRLVARGEIAEARRVAGAVAGLLALVVAVISASGALLAPVLVDFLVPGFDDGRRTLAIALVRILFPGVGLLVLSAWCLGILNSHRRFLLPYAAPVVWNAAIIAATLMGAARAESGERIVVWTAWGALIGSSLQLFVQVPLTLKLLGGFKPTLDTKSPHVASVLRNFGPAFVARGVVQISSFLEAAIASWLPGTGAVAALTNAQLLYGLPISLFGMSVAVAELPELSEDAGRTVNSGDALRERVERGQAQVAFFIVPTMIAFLVLGNLVAGLVFQSGAFTETDTRWVWLTLAGATLGLLPQALSRLLTSAHFALGDSRTPLRYATLRVLIGPAIGLVAAFRGPALLGLDPQWGTAGLTLGTAAAASVEYGLLRRSFERRVGGWSSPHRFWSALFGSAIVAAAAGFGVSLALRSLPILVVGLVALTVFGLVYLLLTTLFRMPQALAVWSRLRLH